MNIIERIRAEIERRIKSCDATSKTPNQLLWAELSALLPFLDTLSEEPDKDLEDAAWKYAPDMPSYNIGGGYLPPQSRYDLRTAFKDGAEWQKEQMLKDAVEEPDFPGFEEDKDMVVGRDYVPVDWVETLDLYGRWKIIPMKDAVEGVVMDFSSKQPRPQVDVLLDPHKYHTGDKVKVIIVKEDGE